MARQKIIAFVALASLIVLTGLYVLLSNPARPVAQTAEDISSELSGSSVDIAVALSERSLGAPDAPVTIEEFASLTCSHCAAFYKETFNQLKEAYIDTGKVHFIFTDYPLNAPALDAAIIARCLPKERYFKFIKFLFNTQNDWAYKRSYRKSLKQNAKLLGGTEKSLEFCLNNEGLRQGLVARMQKAAETHDIKATPSFLIDGEDIIQGAQNFATFQKIIDKSLEENSTTK